MLTFSRALLLSTCVLSGSALASENNTYNQVCEIAQTQGFAAAKQFAGANGVFVSQHGNSFYCNGEDLRSFAKKAQVSLVAASTNSIVAADEKSESRLCVKAAKNGIKAVARKSQKVNDLTCNGLPIEEFVKQAKTAI